jgi:cytoskeletal protein RodZ
MARRKLRIDAVAEVEPTLPSAEVDPSIRGVGATLREARERHSWSVADVAQQLRIRPAVLEAMESGRFEKLPNGAYALGFVRSYADFLGLDRDEIARRVKAEAAALSARTELIFPKPLTESRMPSGVVLIVSLALAVGGYGLWYYHSANTRLAPPRVEAVPERLVAQAQAPAPSPRSAEAATVGAPPGAPASPTNGDAAAPAAASTGTAPAAGAPPAPAPASAAAASPAEAPTAPAQPPADGSAPAASSEPAAAPQAQVASVPAKPTETIPAQSDTDAKPPPAPKQFGDVDANARIVLKATADSWVQVRDHGGKVIFSRILRPGDTYAAPDEPGLVMATGSAGALDILVDGKPAPSIGRVGFTQKNVPLDPERLLSGTAVVETAKPHVAPAKPAVPKDAAPASSSPGAGQNG